ARNLATTYHVRRASRMQPTDSATLNTIAEPIPDFRDDLLKQESIESLDAAIKSLPPICQQVLVLRRKHNYSHAQIAAELNFSLPTSAIRLSGAFFRLPERLPTKAPRDRTSIPGV